MHRKLLWAIGTLALCIVLALTFACDGQSPPRAHNAGRHADRRRRRPQPHLPSLPLLTPTPTLTPTATPTPQPTPTSTPTPAPPTPPSSPTPTPPPTPTVTPTPTPTPRPTPTPTPAPRPTPTPSQYLIESFDVELTGATNGLVQAEFSIVIANAGETPASESHPVYLTVDDEGPLEVEAIEPLEGGETTSLRFCAGVGTGPDTRHWRASWMQRLSWTWTLGRRRFSWKYWSTASSKMD